MFALTTILTMCGLISGGTLPGAAVPDKLSSAKVKVYFHPEKLTTKDKLSFGPDAEQKEIIPMSGETMLVYIDLKPGARFAHPTQCILISTEGVNVIKGDWWLILNGKPLFRDEKSIKVDFPFELSGK